MRPDHEALVIPLRRNAILSVALVVFAVVPALVAHWRVAMRRSEFEKEAKFYLVAAKADSSSRTTYQDAKEWLETHGFQIITPNSNWIMTIYANPTEKWVQGIKRLGWESTMSEDRRIEITFVFDDGGKFIRVELNDNSGPLPRWSTVATNP